MSIDDLKMIDHFSVVKTANSKTFTRDHACLRVMKREVMNRLPRFDRPVEMTIHLLDGFDEETYGIPDINQFGLTPILTHLTRNGAPPNGFGVKNQSETVPFDFVCSRGLLEDLLVLSPDFSKKIALSCEKLNNTIYVQKIKKNDSYPDQAKATYAGHFFENAVTEPAGAEDEPQGVLESHFYGVFKGKIGDHSILFSGEMDALIDSSKDEEEGSSYAELKTMNKSLLQPYKSKFLHDKLKGTWAQCTLCGIEETIIGLRDRDYYCEQLIRYRIADLPKKCGFRAESGFKFLQSVLDSIQETLESQETATIHIKHGQLIESKDSKAGQVLTSEVKKRLLSLEPGPSGDRE